MSGFKKLLQERDLCLQDMDHAENQTYYEIACLRYNNILKRIANYIELARINGDKEAVTLGYVKADGRSHVVRSSIDIRV